LKKGVKSNMQLLRDSALIPKEVTISGWVYEVETGKVRRVV
jgi:carbonic anhydrase